MVKRLQGEFYHKIKGLLHITSWFESTNGHIRIELRDKRGNKFCHWLNPEEQKEFDKSLYPKSIFKKKTAPKINSILK